MTIQDHLKLYNFKTLTFLLYYCDKFNDDCNIGMTKKRTFYLSIYLFGFSTAVAVFRKPNDIPLCFSIDLLLISEAWCLVSFSIYCFLVMSEELARSINPPNLEDQVIFGQGFLPLALDKSIPNCRAAMLVLVHPCNFNSPVPTISGEHSTIRHLGRRPMED